MSFLARVPWGLLTPSAVLVTLAFTSRADSPPEAASSSAYTWSTLHRHGGELRGPRGTGVVLGDVDQRGSTLIAVAFNASLRSTDGGATWHDIPGVRGANDVAFGENGLVLIGRRQEMSRSVDSGATWTDIKVDMDGVFETIVVSGDTVIAAAWRAVMRSMDGGQTWLRSPVPNAQLVDLVRIGQTVIAIGGAGFLARSSDGGVTWQTRWLPSTTVLAAIAFADARAVIVVGNDGLILRSTDAGVTWSEVTSPARTHLRSVTFASATEGMAVGFWGEAIRTRDGGLTWEREATGTRMHLMSVSRRPGGGFLVSGVRETVLAAIPAVSQ